MDLTYSAEDEAFRERVRSWLAANMPSRINNLEERIAWHRSLYEAGYLGMGWPREYGGWTARPMEQAIVGEEMARVNAPATANGLGLSIVGPTLIVHGTEAQKQRYVRKILTAEELWCQLYSEPNAGSDLAALRTSAERQGDVFVVNGQKVWTSYAKHSHFGVLLARTDPDVPKHQGISYFILDMGTPGVEVRPLRQITGGAEFCEVFFDDVKVPAENLIGEVGQGWKLAQTTLSFERGGNTLGRVVRHQANLARLTEVCGMLDRGGRLAIDDPVVRQKLGRMLVEGEVMRYGGLRILSKLEKGQRPGAESSIDKLFCSELDKRHQELILEIIGPYGLMEDDVPEEVGLRGDNVHGQPATWAYNFLWSRAGTIYAGSSEIQKNIIGERVLGLPREPRADRLARAS